MKSEIALYQPELSIHIEVRVEHDTVWLSQQQIADLFGVKQPAISKHLKYRVNSLNATRFRQWANKVLKEYLLHGYSINQRFDNIERRLDGCENILKEHSEKIDFFVRTSLPPREGLFFDGQIFDAYDFIVKLIKSARHSIILIDNYIDENVITMMSNKSQNVNVQIFTKKISQSLALSVQRFNMQYNNLTIKKLELCHDRFIILDEAEIYLIGASLKDLGKRWFCITKIGSDVIPLIVTRLSK